MKNLEIVQNWYETSYKTQGFKAQRLYPNEEFLRFLGRSYFNLDGIDRSKIKMLEVGCGSCSNLWVVAREGFNAFGIDISAHSLDLGKMMLQKWNTTAELKYGSMTNIPYEDESFDVVLDVFSSFCLDKATFDTFLSEANRVLKIGGKIFSYTPSAESDAFTNHAPSEKIDDLTLNGIYRKNSPSYGNFYPIRFETIEHIKSSYEKMGFSIAYLETITRSYNDRNENFQHFTIVGEKQSGI